MQFKKFKKFAAVALAMTLFVPALASEVHADEIKTDFGVYSPILNINVPTEASITVNPFYTSTSEGVDGYSISSDSINIVNGTVDLEKDMGIPVNVIVSAQITAKGAGVMTEYNDFTEDPTSTDKKVNLNLVQSKAITVADADAGNSAEFEGTGTDKKLKLNLENYKLSDANYKDATVTNKSTITEYGSKISIDVAAPDGDSGAAAGAKYADAKKIKPTAAAFALVGKANPGAQWNEADLSVKLVYNAKASNALNLAVPGIATAPSYTAASPANVTMTIDNVGTATVAGVALHAPALSPTDFIFEKYTVDTTTTAGKAVIEIPKEDSILTAAAELDKATKKYDIVVLLSDGRTVTTALSVTGK